MSFGLPLHLASGTVRRAVTEACHAVAAVALTVAALIAALLQWAEPQLILLPAILALVPMAIALALHHRWRSTASAIAYLLIGAASTYWFALTLTGQYPAIASSAAFAIGQPKLALILVAHGRTGISRLAWCAGGYLAGSAASAIAVAQTGGRLEVDLPTLLVFGGVAVVSVVSGSATMPTDRARPMLHRALQDEQLARSRERAQNAATALVHDTILGTLAAIAATPAGTLSDRLRRQIEHDLAQVTASEIEHGDTLPSDPEPVLRGLVDECEQMGLQIETTGDSEALSRLDPESQSALVLAIRQCLTNVARHADTTEAQVAVYGGDADISVLIVDTGRGFSTDQTSADRLGMRMSVHRRIAAVGGDTQVWSTPGRGTAVLLRVPVADGVRG